MYVQHTYSPGLTITVGFELGSGVFVAHTLICSSKQYVSMNYCFVSVQLYPKSLDGFTMRPAKLAVQGISLAIPTGECFGLLGVNGTHTTEDIDCPTYGQLCMYVAQALG